MFSPNLSSIYRMFASTQVPGSGNSWPRAGLVEKNGFFSLFLACRLSRRAFPADWTGTQPHSTLTIDHAASEIIHGEPGLDIGSRGQRFELPQQSAAVSAHFCNESVYGNLNVLCVTGVVRLDPNADVGGDDATPVTLDWPSEATRAAAKRARKKLLKGPANYPGPWND